MTTEYNPTNYDHKILIDNMKLMGLELYVYHGNLSTPGIIMITSLSDKVVLDIIDPMQ